MSRALAHIEQITQVDELPGYDKVVSAHILGWRVIMQKEQANVGSRVVFFEIDSLLPQDDERFSFMEKKHYRVRSQKMCKSLSQGLAMPITLFPELKDCNIGDDVTEQLKITYYSPADRERKNNLKINKKDKYNRMVSRLANTNLGLFHSSIVQYLIKCDWGKKVLYLFFGRNEKDLPKGWPEYISHSDQPRVENMPFLLDSKNRNKNTWSVSEKLDGCSASYGIKRIKKNKYDFAICSRNIRLNNISYEESNSNHYIEMAEKYNIEKILEVFAFLNDLDTFYIQGEIVGSKIQGNPYKFDDGVRDLFIYELVINGVKQSHADIEKWCDEQGLKCVPLFIDVQLPSDMETMKKWADGWSAINPKVKREGLVYKQIGNPDISFKNVSNEYLLKHS